LMTAYMIEPRLLRIKINRALYVKFGLKQTQSPIEIKKLTSKNVGVALMDVI
jgi:hypothetical protein